MCQQILFIKELELVTAALGTLPCSCNLHPLSIIQRLQSVNFSLIVCNIIHEKTLYTLLQIIDRMYVCISVVTHLHK